jgi:hypothetical protein
MRLLSRSLAPQLGIDVDQHTVGGLSLAGMTCDRVAMIEARMRRRIKLDYSACSRVGCRGRSGRWLAVGRHSYSKSPRPRPGDRSAGRDCAFASIWRKYCSTARRSAWSAKVSKTAVRAGTGPRRGVPGAQWAAAVFCRRCRSPEPLARHWVAPGECSVEQEAPIGRSTGVADPRGMKPMASVFSV